jgi:hypothetical protein
MTKRTDIHRPSAINTKDYEFVAFDYYGPYAGLSFEADRKVFQAHRERTGGKFSSHDHGGSCHVCGASALYVAKFYHAKTNTYICTGEECAEKIFGRNDLDFASKRKGVAANKEYAAGKAKAVESLSANNLMGAWTIYTATDTAHFKYEELTIADIVSKLIRYGSISPKQWEFLAKLVEKAQNRPAIEAARAEEDAKSNYIGTVGDWYPRHQRQYHHSQRL